MKRYYVNFCASTLHLQLQPHMGWWHFGKWNKLPPEETYSDGGAAVALCDLLDQIHPALFLQEHKPVKEQETLTGFSLRDSNRLKKNSYKKG